MSDIFPLKRSNALGNLKKIGFVTPSSNTALEPVTAGMTAQISDRVSTHFSRVPVKNVTLDGHDVDQFQTEKMLSAANLLSDGGLDAILWNGTSGSWAGRGFEADVELCDQIARLTGVPASTSSLALLEILKERGIERYALAVPYVDGPTRQIIDTFGKAGFKAVSSAQLGLKENIHIADVPFERLRQLLRDADSPDAECIVVVCTNLPTAVILDEMEAELGKPIFDSTAVTLWKALRMTAVDVPLHGWGQLLRADPVLAQLEGVMDTLRKATGGSRTTLRIDVPHRNCGVDTVCAESVGEGIPPLKLNPTLNQRATATAQWLDANRQPLIQSDCINASIKPPAALLNLYKVKAQMLVGLDAADGSLMGWISVHYVPDTRSWRDEEIDLLLASAARVKAILTRNGWASFKQ